MKRSGHVFGQVTAFASLREAARLAFRANRGNVGARRFMFRLEPGLLRLQRDLGEGSCQTAPIALSRSRLGEKPTAAV